MSEELLAGRYARRRGLGRGAMSVVWLAEDTVLGRQVAVKKLTSVNADSDSVSAARMAREARAAARLNHRHAVAVYDLIEEDGCPYLIMEYVDGQNLAQRIREFGPRPVDEVAQIATEIADALRVAHSLGIVHRDIKPANILIDREGRAKLADFGIARAQGDADLTRTGQFLGTIEYMAPEMARDGAAAAPADIYSLGATLYAALEGHSPHHDETQERSAANVLWRLINEAAPPTKHAGYLGPVLDSMLAIDQSARPTAAEVVRLIAAARADGEPMTTSAIGGLPVDTRPRQSPDFGVLKAEDADASSALEPTRIRDRTGPDHGVTAASEDVRPDDLDGRSAQPRGNRKRLVVGALVATVLVASAAVAAAALTNDGKQNRIPQTVPGGKSRSVADATAFSVGPSPEHLALLGSTIFVAADANTFGGQLRLYDVGSHEEIGKAVTLPGRPTAMAADAAHQRVWIVCRNDGKKSGTIALYDLATGTLLSKGVGLIPLGVTVDAAGTGAYVTTFAGRKVQHVSVGRNGVAVTDLLKLDLGPDAVALSRDKTALYVTAAPAARQNGVLEKIAISTGKVEWRVPVDSGPDHIGVSPGGSNVYVLNWNRGVLTWVVDKPGATKVIAQPTYINGQTHDMAVSSTGQIYVTRADTNEVYSIPRSDPGRPSAKMKVGRSPSGVVVSSDGRTVYVANNVDGTISVLKAFP